MMIPLDRLEAHPDSANTMSETMLKKLCANIAATGHCPALIVRPIHGTRQRADDQHGCQGQTESPESARGARATALVCTSGTGRIAQSSDSAHGTRAARYQILDGHQRTIALRRLGRTDAPCEVWSVDDDQAALLLLTFNRLRGVDDPRKRGALVARLASDRPVKALAGLLPETPAKLRKLIGLTMAPPKPARPRAPGDLPHPVTFFLTADERRDVLRVLGQVDCDRNRALLTLVGRAIGHAP